MKSIDVSAALKAASEVNAARDALKARKSEIDSKIGELAARSKALFRAPLNRADQLQLLLDQVDARAKRFKENGGLKDLVKAIAVPSVARPPIDGELTFDGNRRVMLSRPFGVNLQDLQAKTYGVDFNRLGPLGANGGLDQDAVCFWMGGLIKQVLSENFERLAPDVATPAGCRGIEPMSIESRREEMQRVQDEIEALHGEGAGIDLQLAQLEAATSRAKQSVDPRQAASERQQAIFAKQVQLSRLREREHVLGSLIKEKQVHGDAGGAREDAVSLDGVKREISQIEAQIQDLEACSGSTGAA